MNKKIGPFEVVKDIGQGSFATVYLSKYNNSLIALKVAQKNDEEATAAIMAGKKALQMIFKNYHPSHQNIVKYIDFYSDEENVCLAVEYIAGGELFDFVMDRGKKVELGKSLGLPQDYSKRIMMDLLQGIAHGDIKLENIMLTQDWKQEPINLTIKLIDFGLAEFPGKDGMISTKPRGSPLYLAPEAVLALPRNSFKVDIWACGIVLFCLLTFRMPFDFDASTFLVEGQADEVRASRSLARKIAMGRYRWTNDEETLVPQDAKDFISLLLVRDPAERATASSLLTHEWLRYQI